MANATQSQGFPLALAAPLVLSAPLSEDKWGWWAVKCWGCSLTCFTGTVWGQSLSRVAAFCEFYRNCEILQYKTVLGP